MRKMINNEEITSDNYDSLQKYSGRNAVLFAFFILLVGFVVISFSADRTNSGIFNLITYLSSILLFLYGLKSFIDNGLLISNAFMISFYFFLALNCFGFSSIQRPKTIADVYFYFFGPLIFFWTINMFEKKKIGINHVRINISYEFVCKTVLLVFVMLYMYIFLTKGIRLFSTTLKSQQQSLYVVKGVSGWIDMLAWLLLMLSFSTSKKFLKFVMIMCPIVFTFLNASRTLTMRMLVFMISYVLYFRGKKAGNSKTIFRVIIFGALVIVVFGLWGNYRERVSGWSNSNIGTALQSSSNNDIFNWLYAYSALNYDVLKQNVIEKNFPIRFISLFLPIIRIFGGSAAVGEYNRTVSLEVGSIRGFNGCTFLLHSIYELDFFYFIELFLLAIIVSFAARISKSLEFHGGYVYFIMASVMTVFGNFYLDINGFYAVIMGIFICMFIKPSMIFENR